MKKNNYSCPVLEIVLIEEDLVRTSGWAGLEKDPTTDDPFVGGGFHENE